MDVQVILIFILSLLTINLIVVGVYVVLVLKELRQTIQRANGILDNAEDFTGFLTNPLGSFSGIIDAVVGGFKAVQEVRSIRSLRDDD